MPILVVDRNSVIKLCNVLKIPVRTALFVDILINYQGVYLFDK